MVVLVILSGNSQWIKSESHYHRIQKNWIRIDRKKFCIYPKRKKDIVSDPNGFQWPCFRQVCSCRYVCAGVFMQVCSCRYVCVGVFMQVFMQVCLYRCVCAGVFVQVCCVSVRYNLPGHAHFLAMCSMLLLCYFPFITEGRRDERKGEWWVRQSEVRWCNVWWGEVMWGNVRWHEWHAHHIHHHKTNECQW